MTVKILLSADCSVCKKPFLFYGMGQWLRCNIIEHEDGICFYDNRYGEIHNNHVLHSIKYLKCRKCRKSHQLEEYIT